MEETVVNKSFSFVALCRASTMILSLAAANIAAKEERFNPIERDKKAISCAEKFAHVNAAPEEPSRPALARNHVLTVNLGDRLIVADIGELSKMLIAERVGLIDSREDSLALAQIVSAEITGEPVKEASEVSAFLRGNLRRGRVL